MRQLDLNLVVESPLINRKESIGINLKIISRIPNIVGTSAQNFSVECLDNERIQNFYTIKLIN